MPEPDGQPGRASIEPFAGLPVPTGAGDMDCTLLALQIASASVAGPGTSPLVGMLPRAASGIFAGNSTSPRFRAFASRAVSDLRPNVVSMNRSVDVCSNGPSDTTLGPAWLDTTIAGTRNPSWV